jgi:hypothetical protein
MRLLDEVAQSRQPVTVDLPGRGTYHLPGAAASARALAECPLRYVLADEVYVQCMHIVTQWPELLDPRDPLLRLPADRIWLEWTEPPSPIVIGEKPQRCGILVTSDEGGRSGRIESFWHHPEYGAERAQLCVEFDLDRPIGPGRDDEAVFAVASENVLVPALRGHAVLRVYDEWLTYLRATRRGGNLDALVDSCTQQVRSDLPTILAFCRLLRARATGEASVRRDALNRARARSRKAPLLDHVEVCMRIGDQGHAAVASSGHGKRATARLHLVRGHLVNRRGSLFWRSAHMRGEPARLPIRSRTVMVSMGANAHL